jgi:putative endonuclease
MIFSKKRNATYVGYTSNILKRLHLHNSNKGAKFTKGNFWALVFSKSYYKQEYCHEIRV